MSDGDPRCVAESLLRLGEERATGVLSLWRGQVKKRLYLRRGQLVAAESDLREEALGEILVALGILGKSRLPLLLTEVRKRGQKMGAVLVDLGWASAEDVLAALGEQVRRRAKSCLRWPEADAVFEATAAFVGTAIEYPQPLGPLVFSGLRETVSFDVLLPVLDSPLPRHASLLPGFAHHRDAFVALFGDTLLARIAARTPVHDLVLDPEAPLLIEGLDVLLSSGLGKLESNSHAPVDVDIPFAAPAGVLTAGMAGARVMAAAPDTTVDRIGAELAFQVGRSAFQEGHARAALEHLRNAVELRPDQAAYHAWLGSVLFHLQGTGALPEALDRLEHAVAVDPDSADAHVLLADVLLALGDNARARVHLDRTLALRPEQPAAIDALVALLREAGDPLESERLYRRLIVALGERARPLRRRLWGELAALYASALPDAGGAARARSMAESLGADDGA